MRCTAMSSTTCHGQSCGALSSTLTRMRDGTDTTPIIAARAGLCYRYRVEKYRPVTLDDVVSHADITSTSA